MLKQSLLELFPKGKTGERSIRADDAMTRHDHADGIGGIRAADGAGGTR